MEINGRVQNGVVILEGVTSLPEGAAVVVTFPAPPVSQSVAKKGRIEFPLVRTGRPGTLSLTNEQIGAIFDEEDASS